MDTRDSMYQKKVQDVRDEIENSLSNQTQVTKDYNYFMYRILIFSILYK